MNDGKLNDGKKIIVKRKSAINKLLNFNTNTDGSIKQLIKEGLEKLAFCYLFCCYKYRAASHLITIEAHSI